MARPPELEKHVDLARRAVEVLQREGLDVPMSVLADALEVKRPTLLYHFPTRSHVVEVALEDLLREQSAYVLRRIAKHQDPIDRIYAQIRAVHAFHKGRESRVVFLTQAIAACSQTRMETIIEVGNRVFAPYRQAAADLVRLGIEAGTVVPCDADALMAVVRALIDGLLVQRVMTGLDLEPVHQFLWKQLFQPLKRKPTSS
jgi:AcrR family transcriptional regulator